MVVSSDNRGSRMRARRRRRNRQSSSDGGKKHWTILLGTSSRRQSRRNRDQMKTMSQIQIITQTLKGDRPESRPGQKTTYLINRYRSFRPERTAAGNPNGNLHFYTDLGMQLSNYQLPPPNPTPLPASLPRRPLNQAVDRMLGLLESRRQKPNLFPQLSVRRTRMMPRWMIRNPT